MNTEPIQNYILKSKHNLCLAAAVGEAWPDTRIRIVSGFLDRLQTRFKRRFKGWRFERAETFYVDAYTGFYFWKSAWENQYGIGLQWNEHGEKMVFGVYREKNHIGKRPHSHELFKAIAEIHPAAGEQSWWEARIFMKHPTSDWRTPEVLWQMHTDAKFLEEVAEQLLEITNVSEPIIDRLARTK